MCVIDFLDAGRGVEIFRGSEICEGEKRRIFVRMTTRDLRWNNRVTVRKIFTHLFCSICFLVLSVLRSIRVEKKKRVLFE